MPRIITGGGGIKYDNAAAALQDTINTAMVLQERQDRLAGEAKQQVNLDREFGLRRERMDRENQIFAQQQEQLDELSVFAQDQLKRHKIDPASVGGLKGENALRAAEVLIHQNQVDQYRGKVEGKIQTMRDRFGLNSTLPTGEGGANVAPGVMTDEGMAAAQGGAAWAGGLDTSDPRALFAQRVQSAFESAVTYEDYQRVAADVDQAMLESVAHEQDAVKRSEMTVLMRPFLERIISGTKDPMLGASLGLAQISYSNGDIDMPDMLEIMLKAAREGEDQEASIYEKSDVRKDEQTQAAMLRSISGDFELSAQEKLDMIRALNGEAGSAPGESEDASSGSTGFIETRMGRKFIEKHGSKLFEAAKEISDPKKRLNFIGQRVNAAVRESGAELTQEQMLDVAEYFWAQSSK